MKNTIDVKSVSKVYPGFQLEDISFQIPEGAKHPHRKSPNPRAPPDPMPRKNPFLPGKAPCSGAERKALPHGAPPHRQPACPKTGSPSPRFGQTGKKAPDFFLSFQA